jgi:hypothetical protein
MSNKLILSWNLRRLAADLAAHLVELERAGKLYSTMQADDWLDPYNLSAEDHRTVVGLALKMDCIDCGRLWDSYVVRDAVWSQAGLRPKDFCCRQCLARRLNRPLQPDDFRLGAPLRRSRTPR